MSQYNTPEDSPKETSFSSSLPAGISRLNYLTSELDRVYHEAALKFGLSDSAFQILYALCNRGGSCPLHDICSLFGASKQTINSALKQLEHSGHICLTDGPGRKKYLRLTRQGRALSDRAIRPTLEETHMVYLESNGGRKKKACLTEHGREIVQHTVARLILEEDQILKSWTAKEQELYLSLTQRYLVSLRERVRSL